MFLCKLHDPQVFGSNMCWMGGPTPANTCPPNWGLDDEQVCFGKLFGGSCRVHGFGMIWVQHAKILISMMGKHHQHDGFSALYNSIDMCYT